MRNRLFVVLTGIVASLSGSCGSSPLQQSSSTLQQDAGPSTPCTGTSVAWQTPTVSFSASEFLIVANGLCFNSSGADVQVHSDSGPETPDYTTLELDWTENDREMRFLIYFWADSTGWWSDEIRTYDGHPSWSPNVPPPYADWLYYRGAFFKSPIGATFSGDLDLVQGADEDPMHAELIVRGLQISTTLTGG